LIARLLVARLSSASLLPALLTLLLALLISRATTGGLLGLRLLRLIGWRWFVGRLTGALLSGVTLSLSRLGRIVRTRIGLFAVGLGLFSLIASRLLRVGRFWGSLFSGLVLGLGVTCFVRLTLCALLIRLVALTFQAFLQATETLGIRRGFVERLVGRGVTSRRLAG